MIEYKYIENFKYPTSAIINLTNDCNLACKYCFVEKHPEYMTLDTLKNITLFLYNNVKYQKEHSNNDIPRSVSLESILPAINFFGGEPCLMFESLIKPIILWCEENYPNIFLFSMTTNGTLLNEERIKFLSEHNVGILLSIDGNKKTQNYNRPYKNSKKGSFNILKKNIPILLKYYPDLCARMTVYAPTVKYLYKNYKWLEKQGFKHIAMIPDTRHEWTNRQLNILEKEYNKIFYHQLQFDEQLAPFYHVGVIEKYEQEILKYMSNLAVYNKNIRKQSVFRCGIGIISCAIAPNGDIYGCQEQISPFQKDNDLFKIGDIYNGINEEKHKKLINYYMQTEISESYEGGREECEKCICKDFCTPYQFCTSVLYDMTKSPYKLHKVMCRYQQILFKNLLLKQIIIANKHKEKEDI